MRTPLQRWLDESAETQQSLADRCGVTQATISRWLNEPPKNIDSLRLLSDVTGMSIDEIYPR